MNRTRRKGPNALSRAWTARRAWRLARTLLIGLVTPLLEKNAHKTMAVSRCYVPVVLSMARVIVLLFALAMLAQIHKAGVAGWPDATLAISIVLALPLLNALERLEPAQTVDLMKGLVRRYGVGAVRTLAGAWAQQPRADDDHRDDGPYRAAA